MGFEGIAKAGIAENVHEGTIAVNLSAFTDVDNLFAFNKIGEEVHEGDEVGELWQDNNNFFFSCSDWPTFSWDCYDCESFILMFPFFD